MKKIILSLAIVLGLASTQSFAQSTSFGIKAEANVSNFRVSDLPSGKSTLGVGANLGGFVKVDISEHFAIQPEVMFLLQNPKLKVGGVENKVRDFGVQVPIYAMLQFPTADGSRAYIGVGPYAGFGIAGKNRTTDTSVYKNENGNDALLHRLDLGAAGMIGYEFANKLQINASYKFGIKDILKANSSDASLRNQIISLGIGYRF